MFDIRPGIAMVSSDTRDEPDDCDADTEEAARTGFGSSHTPASAATGDAADVSPSLWPDAFQAATNCIVVDGSNDTSGIEGCEPAAANREPFGRGTLGVSGLPPSAWKGFEEPLSVAAIAPAESDRFRLEKWPPAGTRFKRGAGTEASPGATHIFSDTPDRLFELSAIIRLVTVLTSETATTPPNTTGLAS